MTYFNHRITQWINDLWVNHKPLASFCFMKEKNQ